MLATMTNNNNKNDLRQLIDLSYEQIKVGSGQAVFGNLCRRKSFGDMRSYFSLPTSNIL